MPVHPLLLLLLQIAVVVGVARGLGLAFRRIHQPQVVGEMVAGILLGPSLLGLVAPEAYTFLFPTESLEGLHTLSQVGLLFFMFLVGLELDMDLLRGRVRAAVITSQTSIVVPFASGVGLAAYLYPGLAGADVTFWAFALFLGAAMSVTAFPVLARILTERNLLRTRLGAITIAAAAVDDVSAWCILAAVLLLVNTDASGSWLLTLGGSVLFIGLAILVVHPLLRRLTDYYDSRGRLTHDTLAVTLLVMLAFAGTTEWLGIHALFGAFLAGAVLPRNKGFIEELAEKLQDVTVVLLLPLFFAFTGLRTQIGLLNEASHWLDGLLVILVAVAGKFGGASVAAKLTGLSWRESTALGVLMNTRGLMELVILTIGLELGVISPTLFAMMVLMALFTTFMTTPLLEWIYPRRFIRTEVRDEEQRAFGVLLPISLPSSGPDLLRVGEAISPPGDTRYYGVHLVRALEQPLFGARTTSSRTEPLEPLMEAARQSGLKVHPLAFMSRDPAQDIVGIAGVRGVDAIVMGWHKPLISRSVLGGTVSDVMRSARADVLVYIPRRFGTWQHVLVPFMGGAHDEGALDYARRIVRYAQAHLTVLHVRRPDQPAEPLTALNEAARRSRPFPETIKPASSEDALAAAIAEARQDYDLVVVGASEAWGMEPSSFGLELERLAREATASLLIVHKHPSKGIAQHAPSGDSLIEQHATGA